MNPITVLALWLATGFLVLLFCWPYQTYRRDLLRLQLFKLRDHLFLFAHDHGVPFNHPAYTRTRRLLNGMIRYAHRLSLFSLIVFYLMRDRLNDPGKEKYYDSLKADMQGLSPTVCKEILKTHTRAHLCLLLHALSTSYILGPLVLLVRPAARATLFARRIRNALDREASKHIQTFDPLDQAAYQTGGSGGGVRYTNKNNFLRAA